jgi:hypothetical protein
MIVVGFNWPVEHDYDGYYFEDCMVPTELGLSGIVILTAR